MFALDPSTFAWSAQRVLVVSPHPDDDVLGCGGTLAKACSAGAAVCVLYVTDGSASHLGSRTFPPDRLRDVREDEARDALAELGLASAQVHFLREPDGRLACEGAAADELHERICAHVRAFVPTMVFSPWIRDGHSDHVAVSLAVRRALDRAASPATLCEYEVWPVELGAGDAAPRTDEATLVSVDVSAFRARKVRAIRAHRSQLGELIDDATEAFVLPASLLQRSDADCERFLRIVRPSAVLS